MLPVAALITQVTTLAISILVGAAGTKVPPIPFAIFCLYHARSRTAMILVDAAKAFGEAVAKRHVLLQGVPPRITSIASTFPRPWFVLLHVQLHPQLLDTDFE